MMRFCMLLFITGSLSVSGQTIHYEFNAPNASHHEAEITVTADNVKTGPIYFRMSRSSPGRYATHEFGKNVYNVAATDASGKTLVVEKTDAEIYKVTIHQGTIKLTYTLYGDYGDGTYCSIDTTGYHLNMPAAFMWVKGLEKAPISLTFRNTLKNWSIATQLKPSADPFTFTAPDLQYFMDAPTKVGYLHMREWKVSNPDQKQYTFRLALEATATEQMVDNFLPKVQKIVNEAQAVYGEVPAYDYGTYTFIASINPYVFGDGMEHRNSTMISNKTVFSDRNTLLGTFSHEFFHCWNVERIRPKTLEPFNFEKSNMSEGLWIAEGFTQYYGGLLMERAGLTAEADYFSQISGLINSKENTPGGKYYSPVENSQRAVFVDAGVSVDKTNYVNMFSSYYTYGGALALALDLQLRSQFHKTLDGFMRQMWIVFGKTQKAYTLPEVQQVLATYTNTVFAGTFFKNQVYGHEPIDYNKLLQPAGMGLKKTLEGKAWIGNTRFGPDSSKLVIAGNTVRNTPLYMAGADIDDEILQLDGTTVRQQKDIQTFLQNHKPGDAIKILYKHRDITIEKMMTLQENPAVNVVSLESQGGVITDEQKKFRHEWLGSKAGSGN